MSQQAPLPGLNPLDPDFYLDLHQIINFFIKTHELFSEKSKKMLKNVSQCWNKWKKSLWSVPVLYGFLPDAYQHPSSS